MLGPLLQPTTRALVAYDRITVEGLGQTGVSIERHGGPIPPYPDRGAHLGGACDHSSDHE